MRHWHIYISNCQSNAYFKKHFKFAFFFTLQYYVLHSWLCSCGARGAATYIPTWSSVPWVMEIAIGKSRHVHSNRSWKVIPLPICRHKLKGIQYTSTYLQTGATYAMYACNVCISEDMVWKVDLCISLDRILKGYLCMQCMHIWRHGLKRRPLHICRQKL